MKAQDATILIIDDSAENLHVLSAMLRPQYRVLAASSGEDGLRVANTPPLPDLILLDVMMPGMDGYTVLAKLRENSATHHIPVIFLTALVEAIEVERGLQLGAADYISKPVSPAVVRARVKTQLEAKQVRDWLKSQNVLLDIEVKLRTLKILDVQSRLRATLDAIPDLLFEMSLDGIYHDYHTNRHDLLPAPPEVFIGKNVIDIMPRIPAEVILAALREAHENGHSSGRQFELALPHGKFWFELSISSKPDVDGTEPRFIVLSRDITRRKQMEQQLRELNAHVQTMLEEEKAGIAREIHDDLGSSLLTMQIKAHLIKTCLSAGGDLAQMHTHADQMLQAVVDASESMRRIITGLRPTILDDFGLLAALEWKAEQFQAQTGIKSLVNCIGDKGGLDKRRSIELYRIFQEALTNVAKHSGASQVEVEYYHSDDEIVLSIIDNGCGMPHGHALSPTAYGIRGMTERVDRLGGRIHFDTQTEGGMNVTVILPLRAEIESTGSAA